MASHPFSYIIKEQLKATLKKHDLLFESQGYHLSKKRFLSSNNLLSREIDSLRLYFDGKLMINDDDNYYMKHLAQYMAFGYELSGCFSYAFALNRNDNKKISYLGALLNAFAAIFDRIYDNHKDMRSSLLNSFSEAKLIKAISTTKFSNTFEMCKSFFPVKLLSEIFVTYLSRSQEYLTDYRIYREFSNTLISLYQSELLSDKLKFKMIISQKDAATILRRKNGLLFWLMALPCISVTRQKYERKLNKMKNIIMIFGEVFGLLDDITDITDDLKYKRRNYLTLFKPCSYFHRDSALILNEMFNNNVILEAAEKMCIRYKVVTKSLNKLLGTTFNFDKIILPWFSAWMENI